ncbi:arabinan endo-1,5-alpha-L-arabinosidase [Paenibacillus rhizosphaerae]|uniref:Arabinan endo-1,5-alpha-L-arabinosidase n=1 Tax=Paenibacillus rhizosphaerae TaxID=297318 RepID=A0A839TK71_9BACL|nr:family 43 glycosylhydrolase [Paenibacillus rhizosphaerae]MBB3127042.1 arabinan endo-1,5-alpha-L-arabinosidase [Paenibacillus rhizosphaerae]
MSSVNISNPVFTPVFADPTVIYESGDGLYAYATADDRGDGRGQRLIPILKTVNGSDWEDVGDAFETRPAWIPKGAGIWAPDISRKHGKYLLFYSIAVWGDHEIPAIGVAVSDKPEGPFVDKGPIIRSMDIGVYNSIDPMHFIDDDGSSYLIWGSFNGIYGIPLSQDGLSKIGEKFLLAGDAYEAAHIIKRDGYYYFFGSRGTCCDGALSTYHVCVGRSSSLFGPYHDKEGKELTQNGGTLVIKGELSEPVGSNDIVGPGHHSVFTDTTGQDWMVYHAIEAVQPYLPNGAPRRPLFMDPMIWEDGWPFIKGFRPNLHEQPGPVLD